MLRLSNVPLQFALSDSLWLSLAHSGSLWLTLALSYSLSGSLWLYLRLTLSLSLWLTLALSLAYSVSVTLAHSDLISLALPGSRWLTLALTEPHQLTRSLSARYIIAAKPQFIMPWYYAIWKFYSSHISHSIKSRDYEKQTNWNDHCNIGIHDLSFLNELTIDGNPCHFLHPGANWVLCLMIKKTLTMELD